MIIFSNGQLRDMLAMQDRLNVVVHPQWRDQNFAWHRAAAQECSELMDHLGWKWWKKIETDTPQAQMEVVDLWHFALSFVLQQRGTNIDACVQAIKDDIALADRQAERLTAQLSVMNPSDEVTRLWVELLQTQCTGDKVVPPSLVLVLAERLGMAPEQIYRVYLAKNVLNIFRQDHGYKDGTYVKMWHGREDNEHLHELMTERPELSAHDLLASLETIYNDTPKGQA